MLNMPGLIIPSFSLSAFLIVVGLLLVFFGRKLFWLLIATAGFLFGYFVAERLFHSPSGMVELAVAVAGGLLGALLAVFLQKIAIAIAGILAGGYLFLRAAQLMTMHSDLLAWVFFIIGAIVGLILVTKLFDWSLIFLSSFGGASLVVWELHIGRNYGAPVAIALTLLGILVQGRMHSRKPKRREDRGPGERWSGAKST